jgi:hypothetical protein
MRRPSSFVGTTQQFEAWLNPAVLALVIILGGLLAWWLL